MDEDGLLQTMSAPPDEAPGPVRELRERAREIARNCGSAETECLHLLIAVTRVRCAAAELLTEAGLDLSSLRNTALSYFLSGRMPRKLQVGRTRWGPCPVPDPPPGRPALSPARGLPSSHGPARRRGGERGAPAISPRDSSTRWWRRSRRRTRSRSARRAAAPRCPPPPPPRPPPPAPRRASSWTPSCSPPSPRWAATSARGARGEPGPGGGPRQGDRGGHRHPGQAPHQQPLPAGRAGRGQDGRGGGRGAAAAELRGALAEKIVIELDMATLVAGTQLRGSFSEKLNALKDEVKLGRRPRGGLHRRAPHPGRRGLHRRGPQDAANELKSAMARGEFPCIGATTHDEYRKFISNDPALERRFTPVVVNEPSVPETVQILAGVIGRYEEHHGLRTRHEALRRPRPRSPPLRDRPLPAGQGHLASRTSPAAAAAARARTWWSPRTWRAWWRSSPGCPRSAC